MKPVEIEFLVKNNTRQGLSKVSGGIDGVEKDATETKKSSFRLCRQRPKAPIWCQQALRRP